MWSYSDFDPAKYVIIRKFSILEYYQMIEVITWRIHKLKEKKYE
jgi:hypothetical protein